MIKISDDPNESPEVSEKAAKDYKDANESIERAGKLGTFAQLGSLVGMVMKFASDPRIKVVMDFLNLFIKFFDAAASEDAAATAEALFTEDNITFLQKLAEAFYEASAGGGSLNVSILRLIENWGRIEKGANDLWAAGEKILNTYIKTKTEVTKLNSELDKVRSTMKAIVAIDIGDWLDELEEKLGG